MAIEIYTDGSYDPRTKQFSYAVIVMNGEEVIDTIVDKQLDTTGACQHMGEITAIIEAVKYAREKDCKSIIFTDSTHAFNIVDRGIVKSKRPVYKEYLNFMNENKQYYELDYVEGHGNSNGNKLANKEAQKILNSYDAEGEDKIPFCEDHFHCKGAYIKIIDKLLELIEDEHMGMRNEAIKILSKDNDKFKYILKRF